MPDVPVWLALWLAWATLLLVGLMVLGLLALRWSRWRQAPRRAAFVAHWQTRLMQCAWGDPLQGGEHALAADERWPFMKLWLQMQMSVQGPARYRLAALGRSLEVQAVALSRMDSPHPAQRLLATLALGFVRESSALPLLQQRLALGDAATAVHAARAWLEIDVASGADAVLAALLSRSDLDGALLSVLLRPFRAPLHQALLRHAATVALDVRALRLAQALGLPLPTPLLQPLLAGGQDLETLMAALRLVRGEQGTERVRLHADHPDWRVRAQVARALGHIGTAADVAVLLRLITDAQWWVRYRAAQALLRLPGLDADDLARRVQATGDRYAQGMFASVLAERGGAA